MTVRLYLSTDVGAPIINGQNGSLVNVLDACLVNGYGSKPAAGWSTAFTATNKRAYKQGLGGNHPTGIYLYVDDTGPGGHGGREARFCGFETMTAITPAGTGQFPLVAQSPIGSGALIIRKSNTNDALERRWAVIATAQTVYIFIENGTTASTPFPLSANATFFGDFQSYKTGDIYAQCIIGRTYEAQTSGRYESFSIDQRSSGRDYSPLVDNMPGHFFNKHWNQTQSSLPGGKIIPSIITGYGMWSGFGSNSREGYRTRNGTGNHEYTPSLFPYPNPVDGSMWLAPVYLTQAGMRGFMPGLWAPQHHLPLNMFDTFTATSGDLAGKSFIALPCLYSDFEEQNRAAQFFIEFSDTWG